MIKFDSFHDAFSIPNRMVYRCYAVMLSKESLSDCTVIPIVTNLIEKFQDILSEELLIEERKVKIEVLDISSMPNTSMPVGEQFFQSIISRASLDQRFGIYLADEEMLTDYLLGEMLYHTTNKLTTFKTKEMAMVARVMKRRLAVVL